MFVASSSVSNSSESSVLSALHPSLASLLLSWTFLFARCSPLLPSLLTFSWSCPCLPHACSAVVFLLAEIFLLPMSALLRGHPVPSPFIPHSLALSPLFSLRPLQPPALPHAPIPPAQAADIAQRDKDIGYWTSGVVAH